MHDIDRLIKRRNANYININKEEPTIEVPKPVAEEPVEEPIAKMEEPVEDVEKNPDDQRKIICIKTGVVYNNAREAAEDTGANPSSIIRCCNGNCKTAKGMKWEYYEDR